jgi:hypothetical protein
MIIRERKREYISFLFGNMITVDDAKCLAGVGGLNITTGMIADEDILCSRWFS